MREIFPPSSDDFPTRIAMVVEYDGSQYYGWQVQKSGIATVQQELTRAVSAVANQPVDLICAGRTDSGVHASRQIIHFDTNAVRKDYGWTVGTNTHLPGNISVQWAKQMDHYFHARFSAKERRYRYVIYNHPIAPGLLRPNLTWCRWPLNAELMNEAVQHFLGTQDFSTFRAANCQAATPVKTIKSARVTQKGKLIILDIRADGFLYHMVRNIVGALLEIGQQRQSPDWILQLLAFKDRNRGPVTAPPNGLYFVDAIYDEIFDLPETYTGPNFLSDLTEN